ncbi:hypothetical protein BOTNAR_0023g00230 [Botryotinia narcissicola]|uniref:Uncharacterized protein n=1 Tax=Botryotinia narcissicola TaxID=278944 RepID=A0A4Z1J5Q4_9HELO|nr:hypothetical protein BOTNAR_0023g00230 [Botryotinia narcissicola]
MSGKGTSGSSGSGNSLGSPYTVNSSGTNSQGNSYDNRSTPSGEAYHYSNSGSPSYNSRVLTICAKDGSYYYANGNGSTYYNGSSGSTYTAPDGTSYKK